MTECEHRFVDVNTERCAVCRTPLNTGGSCGIPTLAERMAQEWHAASDHARDGDPYGSGLCNCDHIAKRAIQLGWTPKETTNG